MAGRAKQPRGFGVALFILALNGAFQGSQDAGQEIVEVVGNTPGQLTDRFHLLRLDQGSFNLAQALLFVDALGDVVGEQVATLNHQAVITQRVVADFVVPQCFRRP